MNAMARGGRSIALIVLLLLTFGAPAIAATMSGTLTASASSCTIASGASSCTVTLSWTTTNPVATSAVTSSYPSANTTVATGNAGGPLSVTIPYSSRAFFLYNSGVQLATRTVTSSCVAGTSWNGSKCQGPMSGSLTASASSCAIASGASSCTVTLSWTTTNPVATSAVTSSYPSANTTVATGNAGGPLSVTIPYNSRAFFLYNNGVQLASRSVTSSCVTGTTWNGSVCQAPMSGTLTASASSCTIASGASNCAVTLSWTTTSPVATSAVTSNYPSANTTVATGNSGGPLSVTIPYSSRAFFLYNNGVQLASRTVTSSCVTGTTWNGSVCQAPMSGSLIASTSSCTIASGAGSCTVTLSWTTTNPVATSAVTSNYPSANTTVATGNSGGPLSVTIPYSSRAFFLYNNGVELASRTVTSSCVTGTSWTGSSCQAPMSGSLTASASSCTIASGASSCAVTLSWTTTNPAATSAVTSNYPSANTTVATGNSGGPLSVTIPYSSRAFFLYNNGVELASRTVTSSCVAGTSWTGSNCQAPMSGSLSASASACTIASGASSCAVTLSWTTTNPVATSAVTSNYPSANTTVATGNSGGPLSVTIPYNSRVFFLYNNSVQLASRTVTSSCVTGTTWNGSLCQTTPTGTLTLSASTCEIAAGGSSCTVNGTWSTANPIGTSAVVSNTPAANTTVATGNSGTAVSFPVLYPSRTFFLYNNALELASRSATATCATGTTWTGSTCQAAPTGTLTLSASSCTIAAGASSCTVNGTWSTLNPIGTSAVVSNTPAANTTVATGNSGTAVPFSVLYPSRTFFLYNNALELASRTATAACATGTDWNGSLCQPPMSGSLTASASSCTIASGAGTCAVTLSWTTTNPVATSAVTSNFPGPSTTVATGNSGGPLSVVIPYSGRTFFLYNNAVELASRGVTSSCITGTSWNGLRCSSTPNRKPAITITSQSDTPVAAGQPFTITVHATDADGNLSHVDINWNDGSAVERKELSGGNADATFSRAFNTVRQIDWSINTYDLMDEVSNPTLSGIFGVTNADGSLPNQIDGLAVRYVDGVRQETPVFIKRVNDSNGVEPSALTWIVTHGRDSSFAAMKGVTDAVKAANASSIERQNDQVLVLDWSTAADGLVTSKGEGWIQPIGEWTAKTLRSYGFVGKNLNLIGHSWGTYVSDELAESIPFDVNDESQHRVNSIVGLDPAANTTGSSYNVNIVGTVDFGQYSKCSWAFHSSPSLGNEYTPTTAGEAFVIDYDGLLGPPDDHTKIKDVFSYMVRHSSEEPSRKFALQRLVSCEPGPWRLNGFSANGTRKANGGYEGTIGVDWAWTPYSIDYDGLPTGPDLLITALSAPTTGVPGSSLASVSTTLKNQGLAPAAGFRFGFYFYSPGTGATASGSACEVTGGLAAGTSWTCKTTVSIPASLAPGNYYLVGLVDDQSQVSEADENNNWFIASTGVITVEFPDLVVTALTAPTTGIRGGSLANVSVTAKNQGPVAAPATRVGIYYYSSTGSVVFSGSTCAVGGLAAGTTTSCTASVSVPVALPAGTAYLIAVVDDQGSIAESNESNNWFLATTGGVSIQ